MADNYKKNKKDDKEKRSRNGGILKNEKFLYLAAGAALVTLGVTLGVFIHPVVPILGAVGAGAYLLPVLAQYINDKITEKEIKEKIKEMKNYNSETEDGEEFLEEFQDNEINFKC